MKKIVGTIAAIALATSAVFADVNVGSWGRAIWDPVKSDYNATKDENELHSWEGVSWGGDTSRVGISVHGESENVGFNIDMNADGFEKVGIGDTAYFWAKPFDFLELKIGKVQDDTGRGNLGYGIFNWVRSGFGWTGEDVTFVRFGNGSGGQAKGAIVKVTPIENLWIIAAFDVQDNKDFANTYGNHAQYGVGYTIDGIGTIRAQFIGAENMIDMKDGKQVAGGKFNVAFDLISVENLYLTAGVFIPMSFNSVSKTADFTNPDPAKWGLGGLITAAVGANYTFGSTTLHALVKADLPKTYKMEIAGFDIDVKKNISLGIGVGADVDLGNGLGLQADVRYKTADKFSVGSADAEANNYNLDFLVGLTKGLSNGMVGIGFQGAVAGGLDATGDKTSHFTWQLPVVISAWF